MAMGLARPPRTICRSLAGLARAPNRVKPAPHPLRRRVPFPVNEDTAILMAVYDRLLGDGHSHLPEKLAWQAVTHKSFAHGTQPYNEKLAFFGRRILFHHAVIALGLAGNLSSQTAINGVDVDFLSESRIEAIKNPQMLRPLMQAVELPSVMRWKPARIDDLDGSGQTIVAAECLAAMIGAIALEQGGEVSRRLVDERILPTIIDQL